MLPEFLSDLPIKLGNSSVVVGYLIQSLIDLVLFHFAGFAVAELPKLAHNFVIVRHLPI